MTARQRANESLEDMQKRVQAAVDEFMAVETDWATVARAMGAVVAEDTAMLVAMLAPRKVPPRQSTGSLLMAPFA